MNRDYSRNALDLFRILATVQVFLGHLITHFSLPGLTDGVYFVRGVPILFALCGFLAAQSLDRYSTKKFLIRRCVRVLPGFWSCILINSLIIFLLYAVTPTLIQAGVYFATQLLGLNFYTGDWLRGYGVGTPNGVLWTIGVQLQFFLLAPIAHKLLKKLRLGKSAVLVALLAIFSIVLEQISGLLPEMLYKLISVTVAPYLYFLLLGMLCYSFRDQIIPALEKVRWFLLGAYILWKLAEIHLQLPHILDGVMYNTVTTLLLSLLIFAFGFSFKWRMKLDLTYGFYLYHMVFMNIAIHLGYNRLHWDLQSLGILVFITLLPLVFAWLSHKCIEKPAATLAEKKEGV